MLRAWLLSQFPDTSEVDDLVQEAVLRVLEAHATTAVRSPKAYLYVVARNLALMKARSRHARNTGSLEEIDAGAILDEATDIPEAPPDSRDQAGFTWARLRSQAIARAWSAWHSTWFEMTKARQVMIATDCL
jgi:RNA polymerase sigma-70 factor (ECF subfamily)